MKQWYIVLFFSTVPLFGMRISDLLNPENITPSIETENQCSRVECEDQLRDYKATIQTMENVNNKMINTMDTGKRETNFPHTLAIQFIAYNPNDYPKKNDCSVICIEDGYQCSYPDCKFKRSIRKSVQSHYNTKHGEKRYKCDYCSTAFHWRYQLNKHIQIHKQEIS